jgi:hypothetical protein
MTTHQEASVDRCRFCGAAAIALCVVHVLAIFVFSHRIFDFRLLGEGLKDIPLDGIPKDVLINFGVWLSPLIVVFLSRKLLVVLGLCAVPIVVNLSAQIYYEWLYRTYGTNPSMRQNGDWVSWLPTLLGAFSAVVAAVWLFVLLLWFAGNLIERAVNLSRKT